MVATVGAQSRKVRVNNPQAARELIGRGGKLVADYGGFQVIETDEPPAAPRGAHVQAEDQPDVIELNSARILTRSDQWRTSRKSVTPFTGRKLHLVQFAAPVKPEWREALEQTGARIVSYVPNNTYLIYANNRALTQIQSWASVASTVQWEGEYADDYKLQPGARLVDSLGFPQTPDSDTFAIQLVNDSQANTDTLALIDQLKLEPVKREFHVLQYLNLIVRLPPERLTEIASRPDVISIQPYVDPEKRDERQAQILAGNLTGPTPSAPGYLAWLASKGFTQEQFDASGFVVDVTDSGIDNGTTQPGHFGLYRLGDPAQASRLIYNRLEGTPHLGSTTAGCDGHGNLNAHILAGYNNFSGGFPHADPQGFRYGLGVCPFVGVGASVVFDPDFFTSPNYASLQSKAYQNGARISANSWGVTNNTYTVDAQAFDALVRDAQPDGSMFAQPGNQEMVIVFAAGNRGSSFNTVGAPGTAKNVIAVGASEGVRSLNLASGGSSSMGNDGCSYSDATADGAFDLATFSSRGPCSDGRQKPDLVAPGTHITGGVAQNSAVTIGNGSALSCFKASSICGLNGSGFAGSTNNFFPLGQQYYTVSSGTSHATPAVAGACALLRQYFINYGLPVPSPAMTKAFLMNSARYLTGAGANDNLWSPGQGMGEVNLGRAFDGVARVLRDQRPEDLFTGSGQTRVFTGRVAETNQPLRVTLAWTDAPGSTIGNAFNNDLDLVVTVGTNTYLGNNFSGALSTVGGTADARNNVESVLLPAGTSGDIVVTVTAANINSDGVPNNGNSLDQDFALVIYNATSTSVPVIAAAGSALVVESCFPANHAVDDGETVSLSVTLRNTGTADTTNLAVTMLATNGVTAPGGSQDYGAVSTNGTPASRVFTFTAHGNCGGTINPVLTLQDGGNNLGTMMLNLPVGLTTIQTATFTNPATLAIPDNGKATPYPSTLTVSGLTGTVTKVTATLQGYSHSWPDDVDVLLVGPDGQKVLLMSDCGGGNARNGVTLTFDDGAVSSLPDSGVILSGTYKPTNFDSTSDNLPAPAPPAPFGTTLAAFNGQNPNGNWSLYVQDDGSLDSGSITQGWTLSITTSNLSCCVSAGQTADLGISGAASLTNVAMGSNVTLAIAVVNRGPNAAGFVSVTNLLPPGLSFVSANVSQGVCSYGSGVVISALGALDKGATAVLTIETVAASAGTFTNYLSAVGLTPDPQLADNLSSLIITVTNTSAGSTNTGGEVSPTTNSAPQLVAVANRIVHSGSLVVVTNSLVGTPTNTLTFSLDGGAPMRATINSTNGLFTWPTSDADVNSTNAITIRVTDDNNPPLSDAKSFMVTVVSRPLIAGIAVNNGVVSVAWNSLVGQAYRLEYSTNLTAGMWNAASSDIVATETITTQTNAFDPALWQFYRVRVLP
ncbi:MAG: S8 family serine peptidase [Verrucomicrobiota bacterium]